VAAAPVEEDGDPAAGAVLTQAHLVALMRHADDDEADARPGVEQPVHQLQLYAASKAAVIRFSSALAPLGRRLNIRVNCICPDWVDPPMVQRARAEVSPKCGRPSPRTS
jgi:NAD(P)-dependent dehydrogenase (short-subunit alcohol dehydrogenase family)